MKTKIFSAVTLLTLLGLALYAQLNPSVVTEDSQAHGNWFFRSVTGGGQGLALAPNTNLVVSNLTAALSYTNVQFFGYGVLYSNNLPGISGEPNPVFRPFGGDYFGVNVTNTSLGYTQGLLGFPITQTMPSSTMNFYSSKFMAGGSNADCVDWKTVPTATNLANFFSCQFKAPHWVWFLVGRGTFKFFNCTMEAIGPSLDGSSVGFFPDQGPNTNWLYGCHLIARNGGAITWAFAEQIDTYNYFEGCTLEATETNASNPLVTAMSCSGEGKYVSVFNNCFFRVVGGLSPWILDLSPGGQPSTVVLNNCYWEGPPGPVVVTNLGTETITVIGGNFKPSNFATLQGVTFLNAPSAWSGNTGTALIAAATTAFYAPNGNSITNVQTSDTSAMTRTVTSRQVDLRGLYVTRSVAGGVGHTSTVTIMTNGVASNIIASLNNATSGNDTAHTVRVAAGTEIGIKIVTPASDTPGAFAWSFEGQ